MRVFWLLVVVAVAALYFTVGLRAGSLTFTPLYLLNAQGKSTYTFPTYDSGKLELTGSCQGQSGNVTFRFLAPDGTELSAVRCPPGTFSLSLSGAGDPGTYTLSANYQHYTGKVEVNAAH